MKALLFTPWLMALLFLNSFCDHKGQHTFVPQPPTAMLTNSSGNNLPAPGGNDIVGRIELPAGYQRVNAGAGSFGEYLRNLQIKTGDQVVNLFDGRRKANQGAHYCILDVDVGTRDLQQCADAVIRLRAEYLYQLKAYEKITFNFTNGEPVPFKKYADGFRARVDGNKVHWKKKADRDYSYANFRKYLDLIFAYSGSYSLEKELSRVTNTNEVRIGDVLIQGGFPGHAVLVIDVAVNPRTSERIFLLAQSYMPAQEVHVLINPNHAGISPWYSNLYGNRISTPEWTFNKTDFKRWQE